MPKFHWKDLEKHLVKLPQSSRTRNVLERMFAGEKVNIREYPGAPQKKCVPSRMPSSFRLNTKNLLKDHEGVVISGDIVYIKELQKVPKINWTKVA